MRKQLLTVILPLLLLVLAASAAETPAVKEGNVLDVPDRSFLLMIATSPSAGNPQPPV